MVKLNDSSHEALLDEYYDNYPVGVDTDYTFDTTANTAVLSFTWNVTGDEDNLLMLTWPHHRYVFVAFAVVLLVSVCASHSISYIE